MNKFLKYNQREPAKGDKRISYSQFAMYSTCPKHWELAYVKGLRTFSQSIHTIFGTAFHETLQNYLTVMFEESVTKANQIDINKYLADQMHSLYKEAVEKMDGEHFYVGGEPNNKTYNIYKIDVASPKGHFFLNRQDRVGHRIFTIDYEKTIEIDGGSKITLSGDGQNGKLISNFSKLVVPGLKSVAQPYHGQFIQLDVLKVEALK